MQKKITIPSKAVIDFNIYLKLGEALKVHIDKINEDEKNIM